jgi:sodium/potassium-transporting ATPase subunit alpha
MVRMNDEKQMSGSGDHEEHKEQQQGLNEELIEDFPSSYRILRSESSHAIRTRRGSGSRLDFEKDGTSIKEEIELISPGARKLSTIINIRRRSTTTILPTPIAPPKRTSKETIQKESMKLQYIEHEFDLLRLSEYFHTEIDVIDPKNSHGLTSGQAETLLKQFGPNRLTPPEHMPKWVLFFVQFLNYFMILLLLAGSISIASYAIPPHDITNVYLGVLLILVVIFTCVETFMVESQSDELMSKFRAMVPNQASIIRDGVISAISTEELVVGDLILVKSGDKVPADCRIIYVESLKVDQSLVTGEVDPIDVQVQSHDHQPLESKNLIFNGTLVVQGSGIGVVIRTGDESMIGSIVELTGTTHKGSSTLKADIEKFVFVLMIASLIQAILIFVVGIIRGISPLEAFIQGFIGMSHSFFMNSMSEVIFVANIPQGLPSTIAGALYIVAKRMSEKNVLVKKLDIIETLGSCSVICTDKTGTLTLNQMTVAHLWTAADGVLDSCQ